MLKNDYLKTGLTALAVTSALAVSSVSHALSTYTDNFQSSYGDSLTPWKFFSDNAGLGAYSGDAPNGGNISAIADDGAGNQYMNFFANYGNAGVHANPPLQEAISIFIQQDFTAADAASGETWTFDFDYREADSPFGPGGNTEVGAFIRVFDGSFNLLDTDILDTSGSSAWQSGQLSTTLNPLWENGGIIQFGFNNLVGNYDPSGMYYDNVNFAPSAVPVPAAVWLFGSGLLGLVGVARRRKS